MMSFIAYSHSVVRSIDLIGFLGQHILVRRHHIEATREMRESGTQVHLVFKLLINLIVMEVGVSKKSVEATHDIVQVLLAVLRDCHSVEVVRVDDSR